MVIVDWSAASTPRPRQPSPDACWIAYGWHGRPERPAPEYFRTRYDCLRRIAGLLDAHAGQAFIGVDFSLGYPLGPGTIDGPTPGETPLLPVGRALARHLAEQISDEPSGANNRFAVAADLNRRLARHIGGPGPFWGCPPSAASVHLTPTQPRTPVPAWRTVERKLKASGHRPHSVWKLYTTGSVGSQTLLGLAAIGRWLDDPAIGPRLRLWPFDAGFGRPRGRRTVVVAEVWPSLADLAPPGPNCPDIRDARQVVALRDLAVTQADPWRPLARPSGLRRDEAASAPQEGWIVGLPQIIE